MERGKKLFGKATFVMDRGYDDNKMFLKPDELQQDYVIRLTAKRKLLYHNKWTPATELRNRRKGKAKMNLFYKGKNQEAYLSHVKVQITASGKDIYFVLVYGIRKLKAINALNFYITLCIAFLAQMSMKSEVNALKVSIIRTADPIRETVYFCYYRLAKGICGILSYAKEGVRLWFRTKRPAYRQLCLKLSI